jgi:hypothetical protein
MNRREKIILCVLGLVVLHYLKVGITVGGEVWTPEALQARCFWLLLVAVILWQTIQQPRRR